jgi:putative heme iron utilization protein
MLAQTGRLPSPARSAIDKSANAAFFDPIMSDDPPRAVRDLVRRLDRAALATALPDPTVGGSWPYASLVLVAVDHDLSPVLLLSDLAEHSRAVASDNRVSLLFDGTAGLDQPLTGPRVSLMGKAFRTDDERLKRRFLARHPDAEMYAGFADFKFYRVTAARAHLVAGFGRIRWLSAEEVLPSRLRASCEAFADAEHDIVAHMNTDHAQAVRLYATRLLGLADGDWRMTGIDAEGIDLRRRGEVARLCFEAPLGGPGEARAALVALVAKARAA